MNLAGLILNLILYLIIFLVIIGYPFFLKKIFNNYVFWIICGLTMLIYLIVGRFWNDWVAFANNGNDCGIRTSKAWLMDMCPFIALSMSVCMIIDPSRKSLSVLSPFAAFGGIITITGGILFDANAELTVEYIFLGIHPNEMYFMMHFLITVFGVIALLSTPSLKWKQFLYCNIFATCYLFYVGMLILGYGVDQNATGLVPFDWGPFGEYSGVGEILNLDYPSVMIVGYMLAYIAISCILLINHYMKKNKWYCLNNERNNIIHWYKI